MQPSRFRNSLLSMAVFAGFIASACAARAQEARPQETRPKITGISHMAVYTSDPAAAEHFYGEELGAAKEWGAVY
jgi:catechol-2,3-dioxygenase